MARHIRTHTGGGLFPLPAPERSREPLHEERRGVNKGFFKQVVLYRNLDLINKYFVENPNRWGSLKELMCFDYSAHNEFIGKDRDIKKGFWLIIFKMLEKEKEEGYEKLKKAWKELGEKRKDILFACGVGEIKHPDFLVWVIKKRVTDVVYNDSMPQLLITAMKGIVKIVAWDVLLSERREENVRARLNAKQYPEEYRMIMAREIAMGYVWEEVIRLLKDSGLNDYEIEKLVKRLKRIDKKRELGWFIRNETEIWLNEKFYS